MENTTENKLKFFALYYGQDVLRHKKWKLASDKISGISSLLSKNYYLELRYIESITDEECIELERILKENINTSEMAIICRIQDLHINISKLLQIESEFLRSKGFLVPFMNLTTDQIIEFGWAKIKDNETKIK